MDEEEKKIMVDTTYDEIMESLRKHTPTPKDAFIILLSLTASMGHRMSMPNDVFDGYCKSLSRKYGGFYGSKW